MEKVMSLPVPICMVIGEAELFGNKEPVEQQPCGDIIMRDFGVLVFNYFDALSISYWSLSFDSSFCALMILSKIRVGFFFRLCNRQLVECLIGSNKLLLRIVQITLKTQITQNPLRLAFLYQVLVYLALVYLALVYFT